MDPDDDSGMVGVDAEDAAPDNGVQASSSNYTGDVAPGTDTIPGSNPIDTGFGQFLLFWDRAIDSVFGTNYADQFFLNNDAATQALGGADNQSLADAEANNAPGQSANPSFFSNPLGSGGLFTPSGSLGNWVYLLYAIVALLVLLLVAYIVRAFRR